MFRKILYIFGGLLFIAVLGAAAGLGVWATRLNAQLAQTQADYQALKSEYNKLDSEFSEAKSEFETKSAQAEIDLEDAMAEVTKLTENVKMLQNENNRLRAKIVEIQDKVAILSDFWFLSDSAFEHKVEASDDEQLKDLFAQLEESQEMEDLVELMSYLIQSIDDVSDVSWQPIPVVELFVGTGVSH